MKVSIICRGTTGQPFWARRAWRSACASCGSVCLRKPARAYGEEYFRICELPGRKGVSETGGEVLGVTDPISFSRSWDGGSEQAEPQATPLAAELGFENCWEYQNDSCREVGLLERSPPRPLPEAPALHHHPTPPPHQTSLCW